MKNKQGKKVVFSIISSLLVIIVAVIAYIAYLLLSTPQTVYAPDYIADENGITVIEPPLAVDDFTLTDENNEPISLSDFNGKPTLITFGFTHCPDVCPITLGEMRNIREALDSQADDIQYVFVSVDGERDTPAVLDTYFTTLRVNEFVIGMTGTEPELREFTAPFGVEFIYNEPDRFGNYTVDHTAGLFLVDANQNWVRRYRYGIRSNLIAEDILAFMRNN